MARVKAATSCRLVVPERENRPPTYRTPLAAVSASTSVSQAGLECASLVVCRVWQPLRAASKGRTVPAPSISARRPRAAPLTLANCPPTATTPEAGSTARARTTPSALGAHGSSAPVVASNAAKRAAAGPTGLAEVAAGVDRGAVGGGREGPHRLVGAGGEGRRRRAGGAIEPGDPGVGSAADAAELTTGEERAT